MAKLLLMSVRVLSSSHQRPTVRRSLQEYPPKIIGQILLHSQISNLIVLLSKNIAVGLELLANGNWRQIAFHNTHQQCCESYAQLSRLIALTGFGKEDFSY